jgi:hypothetical protein
MDEFVIQSHWQHLYSAFHSDYLGYRNLCHAMAVIMELKLGSLTMVLSIVVVRSFL